jgi:hypothetical protein
MSDGKKKKYRSLKSMPFGGNALRLSWKELLFVVPAALALAFWVIPYLYGKWETFDFSEPDFRISYNFRDDYWVYEKWADYAARNRDVLFVGDSVIWGMYTDNAHTLSACYNRLKGRQVAANLGIDGLHPVALEGLMRDFGGAIRDRKVYLYFNVLWLDCPEFDLSALPRRDETGAVKKFAVMHPRLVPQFDDTLYLYDEPLKTRIGNWEERNLPFYSLQNHLRNAFYDNRPLPEWMAANPGRNPFGALRREVSAVEREHINRTDSWSASGKGEFSFAWVALPDSRQWAAFLDAARLLEARGNDVTVVVGAFNTHLLSEESLETYIKLMGDVTDQLDGLGIKYIEIEALPSEDYGDASHPLGGGYQLIAEQIIEVKF